MRIQVSSGESSWGSPLGIPLGIPWGILWGIHGGIRWGIPWGILRGIPRGSPRGIPRGTLLPGPSPPTRLYTRNNESNNFVNRSYNYFHPKFRFGSNSQRQKLIRLVIRIDDVTDDTGMMKQ